MKDFRRLFSELGRFYWLFAFAVLLVVVVAALDLLIPWIYRGVIDLVTGAAGGDVGPQIWRSFWMWVILYGAVQLSARGVDALAWYMTNILHFRIFVYFNDRALAHLMKLPVVYFEDHPIGFIGERMTRGVNEISNISTAVFIELLPTILRFIGVLIIVMWLDFKLGLVFLVGVPLFVFITMVRAGLLRRMQDKLRNQFENLGKGIYRMIGNIRLVKLFTQELREKRKLGGITRKILGLVVVQEKYLRGYDILRHFIMLASYTVVLAYGGSLVLHGQYSVGDLVLFILYVQMTFNPLYRLTMMYDRYVRSMRAARRLFRILDTATELEGPQYRELEVSGGEIEFRDVSFGYRKERLKGQGEILTDINFKIRPKEVVALVGPSGVGKTTLVKLLTRFVSPRSGEILIDGQPIDELAYASLRENIAVVLQDEQTFSDTIKNNIRYGQPSASDKEIMAAAKIANIDDFIRRLPKKLNTYVGERGVKLSGGEKQRVAIARAVLKDAPILVLDEATSSLDSENERKIQDAMWKLIRGRTTIIIAHRLSTVKKADKIVVLEDGRITAQGTHQQLMNRSGYYRRLFTMQGNMLES